MMPFLRRSEEALGDGEDESMRRKPDGDKKSYDLLDAVCEDFMSALQNHNKNLLRQALGALCDHIAAQDSKQDQLIIGE